MDTPQTGARLKLSDTSHDQREPRLKEALLNPPSPQFWMLLVETLHEAQRIEDHEVKHPVEATGRAAAHHVVHELCRFLLEEAYFQRHPELCGPLQRLGAALRDLNHGRIAPLVKPIDRKKQNGQRESLALLKGHAARAADELFKGGMSLQEAGRTVASALQKAQKVGLGPVSAKIVLTWRDQFKSGAGNGSPPAALFAYNRDMPPEMGATHRERGRSLIAMLRESAAKST